MYNIPLSFLISHFSSLISVQCLFCIVFSCPPVKTITLIRLVNMKLKEQHILKDSFKYSYDTIADIAPPINRYYSQHCYNPPPMNSILRGRNRNAIFSKSPHGPIFKFFVVIREAILQKMAPILDPVNFFSVLTLLGHCVF